MPQFIEPEIVIPALKVAVEQLSQLSLAKIGLDVTELPFWLAIIGFPLAVFDTCTKHIATALNLLLHNLHLSLREITGMFIPMLLIFAFFIFFLFTGFENGKFQRQMTQAELVTLFYYALLIIGIVACFLFITSLSRITGQGNYVTGIGFLMGALSIYIEVVQEYGVMGQLACLIAFGLTISLWFYGRNYNLRLEKQKQKQTREQRIYKPANEPSSRLKRSPKHRFEK